MAPVAGGWAYNTLSLTPDADAGELWVALVQIATANGSHSASFDDVTLSETGVPEPGSLLLVVAGVAFGAMARRQRPKTSIPSA